MATLAAQPYKKPKGIARPPNSWILYRRDARNNLPPEAPGEPRRAQADVSKLISTMWKNEPDHVRAHYERLAEQAKMEHKMMYPDYKFTPETKQEKERRKAAEAAAKEFKRAQKNNRNRGAPYVVPVPHHSPSVAYDAHPYDPAAYYGDAGPSPPLSAAPSPISGESPPYSPLNPQQQLHPYPPQPSARSSPGSDAYPTPQNPENHSSPASHVYGTAMPPLQTPHPGYVPAQLPHPDAFKAQPSPPQQQSAYQGEVMPWTQNPSNQSQVTLPGVSADEFGSYHMNGWGAQPSLDLQHATAFATGDPSIFTLEGFDFDSLLQNPSAEIEVSMGAQQMPYGDEAQAAQYQQFASLFGSYDFSQPDAHTTQSNVARSREVSPTQGIAPAFFGNAVQTPSSRSSSASVPHNGASPSTYVNDGRVHSGMSSGAVSQQSSHPSYGAEYQQYFNLDANSSLGELDTHITPPRAASRAGSTPSSKGPSPTQHTSYAPPPGAFQAGTRRVAASWKPPRPEPDSPVSPTSSWPYPVSART